MRFIVSFSCLTCKMLQRPTCLPNTCCIWCLHSAMLACMGKRLPRCTRVSTWWVHYPLDSFWVCHLLDVSISILNCRRSGCHSISCFFSWVIVGWTISCFIHLVYRQKKVRTLRSQKKHAVGSQIKYSARLEWKVDSCFITFFFFFCVCFCLQACTIILLCHPRYSSIKVL